MNKNPSSVSMTRQFSSILNCIIIHSHQFKTKIKYTFQTITLNASGQYRTCIQNMQSGATSQDVVWNDLKMKTKRAQTSATDTKIHYCSNPSLSRLVFALEMVEWTLIWNCNFLSCGLGRLFTQTQSARNFLGSGVKTTARGPYVACNPFCFVFVDSGIS